MHIKGTGFVEIYQNCIVYNDDVFAPFTDKANAATGQLWLANGEPMLFDGGKKGLKLDRDTLAFARWSMSQTATGRRRACIVHDVTNRQLAHLLVELPFGCIPRCARRDLRQPRADLRKRGRRSEQGGGQGQEAPI
jgi:2-oxoglutarate ferredoxin oxidoreductase subunit beta